MDLQEGTIVAVKEKKKEQDNVKITLSKEVVKKVVTQGRYRFVIFLGEKTFEYEQIYKRPESPTWSIVDVASFTIRPWSEARSEIEIVDDKLNSSLWMLRYFQHETLFRVRAELKTFKEENESIITAEEKKGSNERQEELIKKSKSTVGQINKLDAVYSECETKVESSATMVKLEACLSTESLDGFVKEMDDAMLKVTDSDLRQRVEEVMRLAKQDYVDARDYVNTFKVGARKVQ